MASQKGGTQNPLHGRTNWAECCTSDLDAAEAFYGAVFGWMSERITASDGQTYAVQRLNGDLVAGLFQMNDALRDMQVPPHWSVHIAVDDLDDALAKVPSAGGIVIEGPFDEPGIGRIAAIQDSVGGLLRLWTPAADHGAQVFHKPGAITWSELMTDKPEEAVSFYAQVLGVEAETVMAGPKPYTLLKMGAEPVAGILLKTPDMGDLPTTWDIYFATEDVDATVKTALSAGGQVIAAPFDVPGGGRMAVLQDPQGAVFEVIKMAMPATG